MSTHAELAQRYPHVIGWPAYARAAVTTSVTLAGILLELPAVWVAGSLVMMIETATWAVRAWAIHWGPPPRWLVVLAALGAHLVNAGRLLVGAGRALWWLVCEPSVIINRQRRERAKARKALAQADAMMRHAQHPGHAAAAASLAQRASEVLGMPLGLRPTAGRAPAAEASLAPSSVAVAEPPEREVADISMIHGLVTTYADGSHHFDPMGAR